MWPVPSGAPLIGCLIYTGKYCMRTKMVLFQLVPSYRDSILNLFSASHSPSEPWDMFVFHLLVDITISWRTSLFSQHEICFYVDTRAHVSRQKMCSNQRALTGMEEKDAFSVHQENSYGDNVMLVFRSVWSQLLGFLDLFHYRKEIKDDF